MVLQPGGSRLPAAKKNPPVAAGAKKRDSLPTQADLIASPWKAEGMLSRLPKRGSSKSESDTSSTKSKSHTGDDEIDITSSGSLPQLRHEHRDKGSCPCKKSLATSWKLKCCKCMQYWHAACIGLNGLSEKSINKLTEWSCPFCWVSPIPTIQTEVDVCHICRNTLSLQHTNLDYEAALVHQKIKNVSECCNLLRHSNFEELTQRMRTLGEFDRHLQHLLLSENSLKGLDSEIRKLTDLIASSKSSESANNNSTLESINLNISELQRDLDNLANREPPVAPPISESSNELLTAINSKLEKLCNSESNLSADISQLKASLQSVQSRPCITSSAPPPQPSIESLVAPCPEPEPSSTEHHQVPYSHSSECFISQEEAQTLTAFLELQTFKQENGHGVLSFGEPYSYTGSKSSSNVPPIPTELKPLFDRINALQTEIYSEKYSQNRELTAPLINSCLINKYEGANSYLPKHSDREVTINPESSIFTLSLGSSCELTFVDRFSGSESHLTCNDRSLYHMTRRSQEVFEHLIKPGSIDSGTRYSFTFRCVSWVNKNSTCLMGDSNTGLLKFGDNKRGTFGKLMPGQKFWSPRIEDLDPVSCMGYANVVLLCGINDVRQPDVESHNDIAGCYNKLKLKIKQIQCLSPRTAVFVCRLLPTKNPQLNVKVDIFNRLIFFDLLRTCKDVVEVGGFLRFARNQVLADELSKQYDRNGRPDMLHLNKSGARVLAGLIKYSVFFRLNGGVDKRRRTDRVDGRSYSNVASIPPAPQRSR